MVLTEHTEHTHKAFDADLQELSRMIAEMGGLAEREIFGAMARACGLAHTRDVKAPVSNVMVFDKPVAWLTITAAGRRKALADT